LAIQPAAQEPRAAGGQCLKNNRTFAAVVSQEERASAGQGAGSSGDIVATPQLKAIQTSVDDVRSLIRAQGGTLRSLHTGR
jgi:hypothetical protein